VQQLTNQTKMIFDYILLLIGFTFLYHCGALLLCNLCHSHITPLVAAVFLGHATFYTQGVFVYHITSFANNQYKNIIHISKPPIM